ncbi:MAG: hypothetical protein BJ554DRAFT_258, partial [Olpidium bornovanus]
ARATLSLSPVAEEGPGRRTRAPRGRRPSLLGVPHMDNLPYAADAKAPLNPAELNVGEDAPAARANPSLPYVREGAKVSIQTKFNYAWGLVKSSVRDEQHQGIRLLKEIHASAPERQRECLYYLALGNYKLGSFAEARRYNDSLLQVEPRNAQAQNLKALIDEQVAKGNRILMAFCPPGFVSALGGGGVGGARARGGGGGGGGG